ncbi:MAG: MFS transporter [Desulfobacterales bacterium]|nr:MFS transporter [Desulfobacterales bacterium]
MGKCPYGRRFPEACCRELQKLKEAVYHKIQGPNQHWWGLAVVCMGTFMSTYDTGAVSVSLPLVMISFKTGLTMVSWVLIAYLLVSSSLLLPAGYLADILGRKKIYNTGFIVFILGSTLCGLSQNQVQLIIFRSFQAVGAAMLQTSSFAIVTSAFPARDRGRGLGFLSSMAAIGITSGPAIGGFIADTFGWRGIFFLNVPLGLAGAVMTYLVLQEDVSPKPSSGLLQKFDLPGACISALAICSLLVGLTLGQRGNWSSFETLFFLGTGIAAMIIFPWYEAHRGNPLVDMALFKSRTFTVNNIARFICFLSTAATSLLMPFYLQVVLGFSPFQAGLLIAPISLIHAVLSPLSGWLANYIRTQVLSSCGMAIMALGLYLLSRLNLSYGVRDILLRLVLFGIGYGIFQTPNNTSIMDSVDRKMYGITSGIMAFVRQTGHALGAAMASAIVVTSMFSRVGSVSIYSLKRDRGLLADADALLAFAAGIGNAFLVVALLCSLGVVISLMRGKTVRDQGQL